MSSVRAVSSYRRVDMVTVREETRKGPWTEQEDLQLVCTVRLFGERRWDFIAEVSGLRGGDPQIR